MTEVYQVSPIAGLDAVRRMLGKWRGKRVALELPEGWLELDTVARMRLLERQAQIQNVELALITRHEPTRLAAKQVGVPVFARTEDAINRRWRMDPPYPLIDPRNPHAALPEPPPWRRTDEVNRMAMPTHRQARQERIRKEMNYRKPLPTWLRWAGNLLMGALIVAILAGFTFYVLPAATITLTPGRLPLQTDVPVTAVVGLAETDLFQSQLPARLVQTEMLEKGTVGTSGTAQKATEKAVGEVVFSNLGSAPVTIPIGTRVSTGTGTPVEFVTTREALLESGVGTRVTVSIEAVEPGTAGNVRANTINSVGGALRFRARVSNANGTFGGGSALVPVVTQDDRDQLVIDLQARAEAQAQELLEAELEEGEWLPPESVQTFVIAQSFDQYSDEEAAQLNGTVRLLSQGIAVEQNDAIELILTALEELVPEGGRLVADSVRVNRQPNAEFSSGAVAFTMTVTADYTTPIDVDEVRATVAGHSLKEATTALQERWLLAGEPEIYLDPAWTSALPNIGNRIQVRIEYEQ